MNKHCSTLLQYVKDAPVHTDQEQRFLDYISGDTISNSTEQRALENWGSSLHAVSSENIPPTWHYKTIEDALGGKDITPGDTVLDIGCGEGFDVHNYALRFPQKTFLALDLGENIPRLAERDKDINNLHFIRGNAVSNPFKDACIDSIVSYGVFHHTRDPQACMREAYRILRDGGTLAIYLYKDHEDNRFKHLGVLAERLLMQLTSRMPVSLAKPFCYALSPFILLLFSYPAHLVKWITGNERLYKAFPLWWGTTPASIVRDLQDRLFASINHRYSLRQFEKLFREVGFRDLDIRTTPAGHFGYAVK